MFDGGAHPEQTVRREQATKPAEQTTEPGPHQPGKTSRAAQHRERALSMSGLWVQDPRMQRKKEARESVEVSGDPVF